MTPSQYAEELVTNLFACDAVYRECTLNEILINVLDASTEHSMREYWRDTKETNVHGLAFHAPYLIGLHVHDITSRKRGLSPRKQQAQRGKPLSFCNLGENVVQSRFKSSPSASTRKTSGTLEMALEATSQWKSSDAIPLLLTSLDRMSPMHDAVYCRVCLPENNRTLPCSIIQVDKRQVFRYICGSTFKQFSTRTDRTND